MKEFDSIAELQHCVGQEVSIGAWVHVTQDRIDLFAEATGDKQWIHTDVERAKQGPFGAPIAHGYLTLSMIPWLFQEAIVILDTTLGINYGLNKVRFPSPVLVGSRIRCKFTLKSTEPLTPLRGLSGSQVIWEVTVEVEGTSKPACVAEIVSRQYA